jgi:hypothetical protein
MAGKNTAAFGIYQTQADVEYAVDALRAEGFRNTDVSVLFPENKGTKDFAVEKNTKAPEGTATGAATGGAIGGILGWLAWVRWSQPGRLWLRLPVWVLAAPWVESQERWWGWEFLNTKLSGMRAASRVEAFC